jgi:hypothetical protein
VVSDTQPAPRSLARVEQAQDGTDAAISARATMHDGLGAELGRHASQIIVVPSRSMAMGWIRRVLRHGSWSRPAGGSPVRVAPECRRRIAESGHLTPADDSKRKALAGELARITQILAKALKVAEAVHVTG